MRNRARNCVTPIPTIRPVGISDRISFFLVGAVVSSFGGSFGVWRCFFLVVVCPWRWFRCFLVGLFVFFSEL